MEQKNNVIQKQLNNIEKNIEFYKKKKRFVLFRRDNPNLSLMAIKILFEIFDYIKENSKYFWEGGEKIIDARDIFIFDNIKWGTAIKNTIIESLIYLNKIECIDLKKEKCKFVWYNEGEVSPFFFNLINDFKFDETNKLSDELLKQF